MDWTPLSCDDSSPPNTQSDNSLTAFLLEAVHSQSSGDCVVRPVDLSRLTTQTSMTESSRSRIEAVSKEELRTLMMASLLLASKWNNSRYLPPGVVRF